MSHDYQPMPEGPSDPPAWKDPSLHAAAREGNVVVLKTLLAARVDVDARGVFGKTALHVAVRASRLDVVLLLLEAKAMTERTDDVGDTPLHYAALLKPANVPIVEALLSHGAKIDARCDQGSTPLHVVRTAASAVALLAAGAVLDAKDNEGRTPSMSALCDLTWEDLGVVADAEVLSALKSDVFARHKDGATPLHHARHATHVVELVRMGASVDAINAAGRTPLLSALMRGDLAAALALITAGSSCTRQDKTGWTALLYATKFCPKAVPALKQSGA